MGLGLGCGISFEPLPWVAGIEWGPACACCEDAFLQSGRSAGLSTYEKHPLRKL